MATPEEPPKPNWVEGDGQDNTDILLWFSWFVQYGDYWEYSTKEEYLTYRNAEIDCDRELYECFESLEDTSD